MNSLPSAKSPEELNQLMGAYRSPFDLMVDRCQAEIPVIEKMNWLRQLIAAHMMAAQNNDNLSKGVFVAASRGNGSFVNSVIAALASIGHLHAPIWEARQVFFRDKEPGEKIPGLGNSFFKCHLDPAFKPLADALNNHGSPETERIVWQMTGRAKVLIPKGKALAINAALLTAAVCELIGYPDGLESEIFIHARLALWADCWKQPPSLLG